MLLQCSSSAFDEGPIFPVGGSKLSPERYIPVSVEDVLNVVIRKPVVRRKEAAGPRVKPLNGALDFGPCGVRESVQEKPISASLSELKPPVRGLKVPLVGRETQGRVCH